MVEIQRLTGLRPGEVCLMRTCDIDATGRVGVYTPESHKIEHHGRDRRNFLGSQAQGVLRHWLRSDPVAYLFSPAEATVEWRAAMRLRRKTAVQPSQKNRRKARSRKSPGARYDTDSFRRAIALGCSRADVPDWHPNQLRHNAATRLRKEFGLDTARAVLGQSSKAVTEIYSEFDREKASEAMQRIG